MEITVQRLEDRALNQLFAKAHSNARKLLDKSANDPGVEKVSLELSLANSLPWNIPSEAITKASAGQYLIANASIHVRLNVSDESPNDPHRTFSFALRRGAGSSIGDTFSITRSGHAGFSAPDVLPKLLTEVYRSLSPVLAPVQAEDGTLVPTLTNLAAGFDISYRNIIEQLSSALADVSTERAKQLDEFKQERSALHAEMANERERQQLELASEREASRREIHLERELLEEERSKLEVSSHKDARRRQFLELQDDLKRSLASPVAGLHLQIMRYLVFFAMILAGTVAGILAYASIQLASTTPGHELIDTVRSALLTFSALGAYLGAAAWLRYFYVRDLEMQAETRRFFNDMARASWVMEAALEIRKEHGEDIPPEWIGGVTQGLFSGKQKDTLEEGAQALAALMGLSASASFGPSGTTVELGRKGGKEIAAAMRRQSD